MIDSKLLATIESTSFSAVLGAASDFTVFVRAIFADSSIKTLISNLNTRENKDELLERIDFLARTEINLAYQNPSDTAIAAYLLSLQKTDNSLATIGAATALTAANCFWAQGIATNIHENHIVSSDESSTVTDSGSWTPLDRPIIFAPTNNHSSNVVLFKNWNERFDSRLQFNTFGKPVLQETTRNDWHQTNESFSIASDTTASDTLVNKMELAL